MRLPTLLQRLLALARLSRVAYFVHQFVLGRILCLLIAVWLLGAAAMHALEGESNTDFRSFGQSAIAILHYLFSGLESKYPVTLAGNVVAILVLTLGVGIVTLFTASLVTVLVERALDVRKIRAKPWRRLRLEGHVLLIGWSERAERVLEQLRSDDLPRKPVVVVIAPGDAGRRPETRRPLRDTWLVEGDAAVDATLARADADRASCALVLSPERRDVDPDLLTVSTTLALESFAPGLRTVVEVQEPVALEHVRRAGVDEVVRTRDLGERMLAQCVITPGITEVFRELLTFAPDSQEVHLVAVPRSLEGSSFAEVRRRLVRQPVVPIGFRRAGEARTVLNPRAEDGAAVPLAAGDRLVVIADEPRIRSGGTSEREVPPLASDPGPDPEASAPRRRSLRVGIVGCSETVRGPARQLEAWARTDGRDLSIVAFEDAGTRGGLERGGLDGVDCLVVPAQRAGRRSSTQADHESLLVALASSSLRPDLQVVVEILDPRSRVHFARLPRTEVVSTGEIAEKLLAQAAVSPGITAVYMELLTATDDSNEIYVVPVPERWLGRTYRSVDEALIGSSDTAEPVIPLGYRTPPPAGGRAEVVLDPAGGHRLGPGDSLIVLAYAEPAWVSGRRSAPGSTGSKRRYGLLRARWR